MRFLADFSGCNGVHCHGVLRHYLAFLIDWPRRRADLICILDQSSGCDTNRSIPSRCDRNFAANCPFTLLPAASSGGANVPKPPLPGDTATIPPPMPLFPGNPMS